MLAQVEVTHAQNRTFPLKAILDRRGETGCFKTCGHTTCVNESPFSISLMIRVGLKSHKLSYTSELFSQQIYQNINCKHGQPDVVFLLAPKMMDRIFSSPIFKS